MNTFSYAAILQFYLFLLLHKSCNSQSDTSYEIPPIPSFIILIPQRIRPDEVVQTSVSILRIIYSQLTIRLAVKQDDMELVSTIETFKTVGNRMMQMRIPSRYNTGEFWFHIEGSINQNSSLLFSNRTKIEYMQKSKSMFIQISKPIYHQNQIVRFRVIPVLPDLTPFYGTLISIEAIDATGNIFKRWLNPMTNDGGILEYDFPLSEQVAEGTWTIKVTDDRSISQKHFEVKEYWEPLWDVNVTMPLRVTENEFGIYGLIEANYTTGRPVTGSANVTIQLREPGSLSIGKAPIVEIKKYIKNLVGIADFLVTIQDLKNSASSSGQGSTLANLEVWANVSIYNWWELDTRSGWAYTKIYSGDASIKFLGGNVRPFKPGMYFTAYIVVYMPDGTHVGFSPNRKIELTMLCNDNAPVGSAIRLLVPDDGIATYTFKSDPTAQCSYYLLQAKYLDESDRVVSDARQRIFAYYSKSGTYMQLSTSTPQPKVNGYMVINIQTNYPTDTIHYVVTGGGNVIMSDRLMMPNAVQSRTFSVAVSPEMAPISRIVAYFVKQDGEVVADGLTFFANYSRLNNVDIKVNRGKDLTMDTIEVRGEAEPGSYLGVNVLHESLYQVGGGTFLRQVDIVDELYSFDSNAQAPFNFTWYEDLETVDRTYLPSPVYGADTNTTFNSSGLLLFTDANFTQVNFYNDCNETANPARAFSCFSATGRDCYSRAERCDGKGDCNNWIDEMNCPGTDLNDPKPLRRVNQFNIIYRLWEDGAWLWHSTFVKPNGKIQFRVDLPKMVADWVVGGFSVHKDRGLSLMQRPRSFSGTRRFFMTVQVPEEAFRGEQIGIRACIFNYWDYWALVEIKASPDVGNVIVKYGGVVNSYSPGLATNKSMQNLVYLEAGTSKYIFMPILPKPMGNTTYTICAYSFIGSNCETRTISVRMNGVTNYYHSSIFLDMTSSSNLYVNSFKIVVPQMFTVPEQRSHRFVPGSQLASISVVGDMLGPVLDQYFEYATTKNVLRLYEGTAENVFFELGYNIQLLRYLRYAGYLTASVRDKAFNYCSQVLQRGFSYFDKTSGAFSNWRDLAKPDPLATAFALWSMRLTKLPDWDRYIYVMPETFLRPIKYLLATQESSKSQPPPDPKLIGSWPVDTVVDRRFRPLIDQTRWTDPIVQEAHRRLPVVSMVIISLIGDASYLPSGESTAIAQEIIINAVKFIKKHILNVDDIFSKTIATLALSRSGSSETTSEINLALNYLNSLRLKNGQIYLSNYPIPMNPQELDQSGRRQINPRSEWPNDGYGTVTSAAFFLTMLEQKRWNFFNNEALDMISWLASERNHMSGFTSTFVSLNKYIRASFKEKDSLMALSSILKFSLLDKNRELYKLRVTEAIASNNNWIYQVYLDKANYSTCSDAKVYAENVWGEVTMNAEGTGFLLLQMQVNVNVEYEYLEKYPRDPLSKDIATPLRSFEVRCEPEFKGRNNSIMYMRTCGRWIGDTNLVEPLPMSGMSVIEIDLPTGYIVLNNELRDLVLSRKNPNLQYARFDQRNKVFLFFDTITPKETCVTFRSERYYPVANMTRELLCAVYEYYERGRYNQSLYTVISLFTNNICNVCGSFMCPYCQDYNSAVRFIFVEAPIMFYLSRAIFIYLIPTFLNWSQMDGLSFCRIT